ncbi:hybrid sensor histidine kinase/response regulator [Photobacterium jeanii]|uniref:histidine kinase n=1 Tax=Photobacterium jeanii TaxID=858640 RepID=A0A178KL02_9GAMM|nr:PAS domain-containing hybrid sensor histidine kinase/response regulator [Photobacterium jeanii]OAN17910.1 hybrid sensor histidine kinase/response regulator [Photobacterium jeanii]PST92423.1 hybrid sensor histidine kinase/response regulator [Photobacterium jeanii]
MPRFESEKLQETLIDLLRSNEREKQLRDENAAILAGISAMAGANNKRQVFNSLLSVLRKYIGFENAIVLTREDEASPLQELVSTSPVFQSSIWDVSSTFIRCMNGESIVLFSPSRVEEFKFRESEQLNLCQSALLTGVKVSTGDALLLFMHSEHGQFTPQCRRVLDRFRPLLERAIIDIDYRERLQSLVAARTQELTYSQQRFKDFANTVGDWFWEIDTDLCFTYISAPDLAGHIVDDDSILDMFDEQDEVRQQLLDKLNTQKPFEDVEWQLPESEGGLWISISGTAFFSKQGKLLGYRGTAKNITNRKKRMFELLEARKQAESANKAKSEFLAMMSHEIRTPLNGVLGLMDMLADSGLDNTQQTWLNQMDQSAQLLLTIINDILDLSRIESGNFELYCSRMRIHDCIDLVISQLREQALSKNITLTATIEPSVPEYIEGDKNRIAQIMFNLIGNAIKFTNEGSVTINAKVENGQLRVSVTDTGIGIAQDAQKNLFTPFSQADCSITRRYGGTGLGLAISQHLINKMNGNITLQSELGKGSCFTLHLPYSCCEIEANCEQADSKQTNDRALNILLAEDSHTNQLVAKLMLEKRGHKVSITNNGEEAIAEFENKPAAYDLILMDISMPVLDGLQATQELRSRGHQVPIVALTANAMYSDKVMCEEAGMNDFIAKPIQASELEATLLKYQS